MKLTWHYLATAFVTTALLVGCGDEDSPDPGSGFSSTTYQFYQGLSTSSHASLNALDPANPGSPILVEPDSSVLHSSRHTITHGTFNSTTKVITDNLPYAVIYAKTDGKLYRVSARKSGSLSPVQVSSETNANQMCQSHSAADRSNPDHSQFVYSLHGADGNCSAAGDNIWKMVRLGMGNSEHPVPALPPVVNIGNSSGGISGWLVNNAGELQQCDQNFLNCTLPSIIGTLPDSVVDTVRVPGYFDLIANRFLLNINENVLATYDGNTQTLTPLFETSTIGQTLTFTPVTDKRNVYFSYNKNLFRLAADGSTGHLLATDAATPDHIQLTANRVIYRSATGIGIASKDATGINNTIVAIRPGTASYHFVSGTNIYYTTLTASTVTAGSIDENGNNHTTYSDAAWIGVLLPTTLDLKNAPGVLTEPARIILAHGMSGNGFSGATLTQYDAATRSAIRNLGALRSGSNLSTIFCSGQVGNILCDANFSGPAQSDIFFANTEAANSLQQITNTPDKFESSL